MPDQQLTVEEVAAELRVHPETVRQWIRDGELDAFDTGRGYRISRADLDDFIRRRKTGRRHKKRDEKEES
jgi:excisionase family DNA binding protein